MWILALNDMRSPQIEIMTNICRADTEEELRALVEREKVAPYKDGHWRKIYRKGGPLEWFNAPSQFDTNFYCAIEREELVRRAENEWDSAVGSLPTATEL
jgi:hypothetical protein